MGSYRKKRPPAASFERLTELVYIVIWFALVTSIGEFSLLVIKKYFFHRELGLGLHVLWMAPLAEVCFFGICGLILFAVRCYWPRLLSVRRMVCLLAFPGFFGLLGMYPKLQAYAVLLLAAGLAMQTARLITGHARAFLTLVYCTIGWLAALIGGLAVSVLLWQILSEQRAFATLPPAPPGAPNVLLITLDTVRAQSLSLYGYARPTTPQLERWAKTGVRFERAFATAPWTLPSHASIFTGRFPHETQANWLAPLDGTYPTLAEVLRQRGYVTAGFVANMTYCGEHSGLSRGFSHYEAAVVAPTEFVLSSALVRMVVNAHWLRRLIHSHQIFGRKDAAEVNSAFLRWLPRQGQRPFFVFLNYFDAHEPYLPPPPFAAPSASRGWWEDVSHTKDRSDYLDLWKMSPQQTQALREAYEGAIAYLDQQLGRLFDELHHRGVLDNTLVIVTSDHGEQFGEHRLYGHGNSLYSQALHVPLVLFLPRRVPAGLSIPEPVSLRD